MQWRRTGPTVALLIIGLALLPAGLVVGQLLHEVPVIDRLDEALPLAGLVLMTDAAALVAAHRVPATTQARTLCRVFLGTVLLAPLVAVVLGLSVGAEPLVPGVLLVGGLSLTVVLGVTRSQSRRRPRELTGAFGLVLLPGVGVAAVAVVLGVLADAGPIVWVPAMVLGAASVLYLTAPATLLATRRVAAVVATRWLATAFLAAVYLLPFVVTLVPAEEFRDGLAARVADVLLGLLALLAGIVGTLTLAYDSAVRRRRPTGTEAPLTR